MPTKLDIKVEAERLREMYNADPQTDSMKVLIYGDIGSGKTTFACSGRTPIIIHSFDPGGTKHLKKRMDEGEILCCRAFEDEDPKNPSAFVKWTEEFDKQYKGELFKQCGTYVLDSFTTFADALMNNILNEAGRAGTNPIMQDYLTQINRLRDTAKLLTSLPCDVVVPCHIDWKQDEESGRMVSNIMITGKASVKIPILFDEMYAMICREGADGMTYKVLTKNNGKMKAKSRIGGGGVFDLYEEANLLALRKKAGLTNVVMCPT